MSSRKEYTGDSTIDSTERIAWITTDSKFLEEGGCHEEAYLSYISRLFADNSRKFIIDLFLVNNETDLKNIEEMYAGRYNVVYWKMHKGGRIPEGARNAVSGMFTEEPDLDEGVDRVLDFVDKIMVSPESGRRRLAYFSTCKMEEYGMLALSRLKCRVEGCGPPAFMSFKEETKTELGNGGESVSYKCYIDIYPDRLNEFPPVFLDYLTEIYPDLLRDWWGNYPVYGNIEKLDWRRMNKTPTEADLRNRVKSIEELRARFAGLAGLGEWGFVGPVISDTRVGDALKPRPFGESVTSGDDFRVKPPGSYFYDCDELTPEEWRLYWLRMGIGSGF